MLIRGPSEGHQRPIRGPSKRQSEAFGASAGRAQSGAIRRHSVHLQAEPVVAQHDHRLFAPRALDGTPLILLNLRVDDVAIRDATDEGGNRAYSAAIKRHPAPSSEIKCNQAQSSAINCNHTPSGFRGCASSRATRNHAQSRAIKRHPRTHVEQSHAPSGTASTAGTQHFWW